MRKWGLLVQFTFIQDWVSKAIAGLNPAVVHNLGKYLALKKVFYLSAIEDLEGDYLEFGVFAGSSFCHVMRLVKKLSKLNPKVLHTRFYGFDSFLGFGELKDIDYHPFYTDQNFETSFQTVNRRAQRVGRGLKWMLVPGFFNETLKGGALPFGIEKAKVIFIDSDTYSSARDALTFCLPTIQAGTFIVLDDYFSYKGSEQKGVALALNEFVSEAHLQVRLCFHYGMGGGAVYIVSKKLS